ncbi:hypothetical protein D3C84_793250 [compost metagenome]
MLEVVVPLTLPRRFPLNRKLFQLDAVAKGRILQLETGWQHLHQQGIGHRRFATHIEPHHHQIADPYLGRIKLLAVTVEPAAGDAHALADARGRLFGVANQCSLHIERALALVGNGAGCQRLRGAELHTGLAGKGALAIGRYQPGLPVGGGVKAGESQQGEALLGAEPLTMGQGIGHLGAQRWPALLGQLVLTKQG